MGIETRRGSRPGQALTEFVLGLFAFTLVFVGLIAFVRYILVSQELSRGLRAEAGRAAMGRHGLDESYSSVVRHDTITVSPMAADYIFGSRQVEVREEVHIPAMGLDAIENPGY